LGSWPPRRESARRTSSLPIATSPERQQLAALHCIALPAARPSTTTNHPPPAAAASGPRRLARTSGRPAVPRSYSPLKTIHYSYLTTLCAAVPAAPWTWNQQKLLLRLAAPRAPPPPTKRNARTPSLTTAAAGLELASFGG
jgi:hypothetical protein